MLELLELTERCRERSRNLNFCDKKLKKKRPERAGPQPVGRAASLQAGLPGPQAAGPRVKLFLFFLFFNFIFYFLFFIFIYLF